MLAFLWRDRRAILGQLYTIFWKIGNLDTDSYGETAELTLITVLEIKEKLIGSV